MGCSASVPELQEEDSPFCFDCFHDRLPGVDLLLCVDAWGMRIPACRHEVSVSCMPELEDAASACTIMSGVQT